MKKKPEWFRIKIPSGGKYFEVEKLLSSQTIHTVCREALCPNRLECWGKGTFTFLLLGKTCTRRCLFCAVEHAPNCKTLPLPDPNEPEKICEIVGKIGIKYVVLTSVTRDDLDDGGANHIAKTIRTLKNAFNDIKVEALIPDILPPYLEVIIQSGVDVLAHNIEVTRKLTHIVRDPKANYEKSLEVLLQAKNLSCNLLTKSSMILGLGESMDDVVESMKDLRNCSVDILTLGQYLQPGQTNIPVKRFLELSEWEELKKVGEEMGFKRVISGPLVRSSYLAGENL